MAVSNRERVAKGFELLKEGLIPFVERELKSHIGPYWIEEMETRSRFGLKRTTDGGVMWDTQSLLKAMADNWKDGFKNILGPSERSYVGELIEFRNKWAHEQPFSSDDASRALETMQRLLTSVGAIALAAEVEKSKFELQRIVFSEQARQKTRSSQVIEGNYKVGLRPWREIVTPHPDVASGEYMQAEFAADLHNVHNGIGGSEYTDPIEFFRRTFITEGLRELLTNALLRLSGKGGDPLVELQTNFGGGKTHSMLALYHLFSKVPANALPGVEAILKAADVDVNQPVNRAVLVGTHLSVGEESRKSDGTVIRTLWGEMAWQIGGKQGFAMVAESDAKGTSPGAAILSALFSKYAPCLILIDEWVAYSRQTVDHHDLPSGSFEAQATFAQALTEAAKSVKNTLVVASIPTSAIEIGGKNGEYALSTLKNIFERIGTPWRPASADEGFEIVRRRLFEPITDKNSFAERDAVVESFARMYRENKSEFPSGCAEEAYRRKLEAAYPIHPDVFDQLYGEWSTLDKFQRTRGVLRLLAKVIHRLWDSNEVSLLILPASIPMDDPGVKSELTRYLEDQWEPIISEDVDGPNSLPRELDNLSPNMGRYSACRRVARTLYLGTAPGSSGKNPGIDDRRVRLGCTQPGENAPIFIDALRRLSDKAKHIHQDGNRYWISTKANLNRLADDRASSLTSRPEELHAEIVRRIKDEYNRKNTANRGDFAGVHACPETTNDVEDKPEARLVILGPQYAHQKGQNNTEAIKQARAIFEGKGSSPRIYKNMLVFLVPDSKRLDDLMQAAAQFLAWNSINSDYEALNLDAYQRKQTQSRIKFFDETIESQIKETWTLALAPKQKEPPPGEMLRTDDFFIFEDVKVSGDDPLAKRTSNKLKNEEHLVPVLGGVRLRLSLDKYLWKNINHVKVSELAEWFGRYLYLPRIVNRDVLIAAIKDGLGQMLVTDTFAVASYYDEALGRYVGLQLQGSVTIENNTLLVKPEVAVSQNKADSSMAPDVKQPQDHMQEKTAVPAFKQKPRPNLFVGSVKLNAMRLGSNAGEIAESVLQHLSTLPGAEVELKLEIHVKVPGGITDDLVRVVTENCNTLKFENKHFEKEE